MHRYQLSRAAMKSMRRIPKNRLKQIFHSLDDLAATEKPTEHHNVTVMKGEWLGMYRMRIGSYRAIFEVIPDPEIEDETQMLLISVESVGSRGSIYG